MPNSSDGKVKLGMLQHELQDLKESNKSEHSDIRSEIADNKETLKDVAKDLNNLVTNHVVFKTKVMVYWAVGVGILSAGIQLLITYISKRI